MKKFLTGIAAVALSGVMLFSGCSLFGGAAGVDGRDGRDGKDVTIDDVYNKYVEENGEISFDDFLKTYLSYEDTELKAAASLQAAINRSMMSGVTVLSRFGYTTTSTGIGGLHTSKTTYKVFGGSGVFVSVDREAGDAYVITNCHVVYDDTSNSVYCNDIRLYLYGQDTNGVNYQISNSYDISGDENYRISAEIVGASQTYDIALLKVKNSEIIKRNEVYAAEFSNEEPCLGEPVYAVGSPVVQGLSVTTGIVAKDSEYIELSLSDDKPNNYIEYRVIRTTAPINHGNSGGALFNNEGKIVAIVNSKDEGDDVDNLGYALPANSVKRLIPLMIDQYTANGNKMISNGNSKGGINKAFCNITSSITDSYARLNAKGIAEIKETVKITDVNNGPAKGKLMVGDVLRAVKITSSSGEVKDELAIDRQFKLSEALLSVRLGDSVTFTVERGGNEIEVTLNFNSNNYFKYYA